MTGFRIGWAVANPAVIEAITNIQAHLTSGPNVLMQKAAIGAIYGPQDGVTELAHQLELNRNVLVEEINKIPNVKLSIPHGTFYSFVDFSAYEKDSVKLALDIFIYRIQLAIGQMAASMNGVDCLVFTATVG